MLNSKLSGGLSLIFSTVLALASGPPETARTGAVGSVMGIGQVWLDQQLMPPQLSPALPIYPGDFISTGKASGAVIRLSSRISVTLGDQSAVTFRSWDRGTPGAARTPVSQGFHMPDAARLDLDRGEIAVLNGGHGPVLIRVPEATVRLEAGPEYPAMCRVAAVGRGAAVFSDRGRVVVESRGGSVTLPPGNHVRLASGVPLDRAVSQAGGTVTGRTPSGLPAPQASIGSVTDSVPDESVQHRGTLVEEPLVLGELVYLGDKIRTLGVGRVRIQLLDGSFLNLNPSSLITLAKFDTKTNQTEIQLASGEIRAESKPGVSSAGFTLRTPDASIEGSGATVVVDTSSRRTRACVVVGTATVRNSDPAVAGAVKLREGDCTIVSTGQAPTSARRDNIRVRRVAQETEVSGNSLAQISGGGPAGPVVRSEPRGIPGGWIGPLAAEGIAFGLSAGYWRLASDTNSSLTAAQGALSQAAVNFTNARTAAIQANSDALAALAAAQNAESLATAMGDAFTTWVNENLQVPSPSLP